MAKMQRKYNRDVRQVFNKLVYPKIPMALWSVANQFAVYCKKNHRYQNRTGALEDSIKAHKPEHKRGAWTVAITAGGWARAKYSLDYARRKAGGGRRKSNIRYQRGKRFSVKRGMGLLVNYAWWVEKKGFPVLKQGAEKFRNRIVNHLKGKLRIQRIPI